MHDTECIAGTTRDVCEDIADPDNASSKICSWDASVSHYYRLELTYTAMESVLDSLFLNPDEAKARDIAAIKKALENNIEKAVLCEAASDCKPKDPVDAYTCNRFENQEEVCIAHEKCEWEGEEGQGAQVATTIGTMSASSQTSPCEVIDMTTSTATSTLSAVVATTAPAARAIPLSRNENSRTKKSCMPLTLQMHEV